MILPLTGIFPTITAFFPSMAEGKMYILFASLFTYGSTLFFGKYFVYYAQYYFRTNARENTPIRHKEKNNIPTMGGIYIIACITLNWFIWGNIGDKNAWLILASLWIFGAIGLWDDWQKIRVQRGISVRAKWLLQLCAGLILVGMWMYTSLLDFSVVIPFVKHVSVNLGWFFILWALFIIIGTSNAINLTDGLDGLALGSIIPAFVTFSALSFYYGATQLTLLMALYAAVCTGFLHYNVYPARIFMGDVGSLSLGASLGFMALITKQEIILGIIGIVFVIETISVMLQVFSYKKYKKRIFRMAPLHYHFELLGYHETTIMKVCAAITVLICLLVFLLTTILPTCTIFLA